MTRLLARAVAVLAAAPILVSTAHAAGFDFNDHGSRALGMGGAHAGLPDDGTAIYYNPAGLTAIREKLTLTLDSGLISQSATFHRAGTGAGGVDFPEVENDAGMFFSPFLSITYKPTERLAFAFGVHGPPSVGNLEYADPLGAGSQAAQQDRVAPQRHMLIERSVLVAYPGLSAAYAITDWLSVGANLQLVYGSYDFIQNIEGSASAGGDQRVHVDTSGIAAVTGILGATVRLAEGLHLGASWRPRYEAVTEGTIEVRPYVGVEFDQRGEDIEFTVPFPDVIRLGLDWRSGKLHLATDFVFETYSVVDNLEIDAQENISFQIGGAGGQVIQFGSGRTIARRWEDSWSIRAGAEYGVFRFGGVDLTPRVGALYESGAIPEERSDVSFPNWERYSVNAGVTAAWGRYALTVGYGHIFQPERNITNSTVVASQSPALPAGTPQTVVGNGTFNGSYDIINIGLHAAFDGQ